MEQTNELKPGDIVKIKKEWLNSPTEAESVFLVLKNNFDIKNKRCQIEIIEGRGSKLPIRPIEVVSFEMVYKPVDFNIEDYINSKKALAQC